ncbi:hypothetical protein HanRHA438_Chr15g0683231 [Helianthus annuus]|nr:hypothetical protein HanRHA438_Chr15g0683231 [Helianthus annuus]
MFFNFFFNFNCFFYNVVAEIVHNYLIQLFRNPNFFVFVIFVNFAVVVNLIMFVTFFFFFVIFSVRFQNDAVAAVSRLLRVRVPRRFILVVD